MVMQKLFETLQLQIVLVLDALNELRRDTRYELHRLSQERVGYLEDLAAAPGRLAVVASPAHLKRLQASRLDGLAPRLAAL